MTFEEKTHQDLYQFLFWENEIDHLMEATVQLHRMGYTMQKM